MIYKLTVPFALLALQLACGGSEPPPAPETASGDAPAPPPPPPPKPTVRLVGGLELTPLECKDGATEQTAETEQGVEQWCDRGGVEHGPIKKFYKDGQKAEEGFMHNNTQDQQWYWWHPNGQKAASGRFDKDKPAGSWTYWHDNGNRAQEGDYLVGLKAGRWTKWYESGAKKEEGIFYNDQPNGDWLYFDDTDKDVAVRRVTFRQGEKVKEVEIKPDKKDKKDEEDAEEK